MGFETSGPNEAMIVSGFGYTSPAMIPGGRVWVWPCVQQIQRISLNTMTLQINSDHVNTKQGVPISCIGVAQVKVESRQEQMLSTACTHFLGKDEETIRSIALETMEGHQRAIMGQMTVEEIYQDRKAFSVKVFEVASTDLMNMGIFVVSYTLKDIRDRDGYLKALGMGRTAQVKRDARIGEAHAKMEATMKEAEAEQERMMSKYENDTLIADSKREYDLRKAENKKEVETQKAIEKLAHALQEAKTMQDLKNEEMKIEIVKRTRQIELQDQEILRREKELEATVMKPVSLLFNLKQKIINLFRPKQKSIASRRSPKLTRSVLFWRQKPMPSQFASVARQRHSQFKNARVPKLNKCAKRHWPGNSIKKRPWSTWC